MDAKVTAETTEKRSERKPKLDGRTRIARLMAVISDDLRGRLEDEPTIAEALLIDHAASLALAIHIHDGRLKTGQEVTPHETRCAAAMIEDLIGTLKQLGLHEQRSVASMSIGRNLWPC